MKLLFALLVLFAAVYAQTPGNATNYCLQYQANCPTQFTSEFQNDTTLCVNFASTNLTAGLSTDSTFTLGCLETQAVGGNCAGAPVQGLVCGVLPDNFCDIQEKICPGSVSSPALCQNIYGFYASFFLGTPFDVSGPSLSCRFYHLMVAATVSAADHCPHTQIDGGEVCGTIEENYPITIGLLSIGVDMDGFTTDFDLANFTLLNTPVGSIDDRSVDTIGCRLYHAGVALSQGVADPHMYHAGFDGGNVCGTPCESYCRGMMANCNQFADSAQCLAACELLHSNTSNLVLGSNGANPDLQCRLYHLGVSIINAGDSAQRDLHCYHASLSGGNFCGDICENYCAYVFADGCNGADFGSMEECMQICPHLEVGLGGDTSGNSLECRFYHLGVSASLPDHCDHTGISGGGVCGGWCENYCNYTGNWCQEEFASLSDCMNRCSFMNLEGINNNLGDADVQCRIHHVAYAYTSGDYSHCAHGGFTGVGVCGSLCENLCTYTQNTCSEDPIISTIGGTYLEDCTNLCGLFESGFGNETGGNSVSCRLYHVGVAMTDAGSATTHCPHTEIIGGGACGSICDAFCTINLGICNEFSNMTECLDACASYNASGVIGDTSGDTLQCRLYHVAVAFSKSGAERATHCSHAGQDGAGVCGGTAPTTEDTNTNNTNTNDTGATDTTADTTSSDESSASIVGFAFAVVLLSMMI